MKKGLLVQGCSQRMLQQQIPSPAECRSSHLEQLA